MERKRYSARLSLEVVETLPMPTAKPKQETMNPINQAHMGFIKTKNQTTRRHIRGVTYTLSTESIKFLHVVFLT